MYGLTELSFLDLNNKSNLSISSKFKVKLFSLILKSLKFIEFSLPHLSAYQLTFEPKTKFYRDLMINKIREADENVTVRMFSVLNSLLEENKYPHIPPIIVK